MSAANGSNNEGHGHVYQRPDGKRTRCGGPLVCSECGADYARKDQPSAAGEKVPEWMRSQVKRSNSGGILYNAIRIDTGVECDEVPSYDSAVIDSRVARLNAAGKLNSYDAILTQCEALQVELSDANAAYASQMREIVALKAQRDALEAREKALREALEAIKAKCAAPALESDQRDAVHFAYNTASAALATGAPKP